MQTTFIQANGLRFEVLEALRLRTISFDAVKEPTLGPAILIMPTVSPDIPLLQLANSLCEADFQDFVRS